MKLIHKDAHDQRLRKGLVFASKGLVLVRLDPSHSSRIYRQTHALPVRCFFFAPLPSSISPHSFVLQALRKMSRLTTSTFGECVGH